MTSLYEEFREAVKLSPEQLSAWVTDNLAELLSALADQRRLREAEVVQLTSSEAHTIGWWPEGSGKRVAIVLLDQEGE